MVDTGTQGISWNQNAVIGETVGSTWSKLSSRRGPGNQCSNRLTESW